MLYEMLAGVLPYSGGVVYDLMMRIANEPAPPLSDRRPGLPAPMLAAVERMMSKDPARRPNAGEARRLLAAQ